MRGSFDARNAGRLMGPVHQCIQMITETSIGGIPPGVGFFGKQTRAEMNGFGALRFQNTGQIGDIVSRTPAGKNAHRNRLVIAGKSLFTVHQTSETVRQGTSILIFLATDNSDFCHFHSFQA